MRFTSSKSPGNPTPWRFREWRHDCTPVIPRIIPGQRITPAQVEYLRISMKIGAFPYDASDLELRTVRLVA